MNQFWNTSISVTLLIALLISGLTACQSKPTAPSSAQTNQSADNSVQATTPAYITEYRQVMQDMHTQMQQAMSHADPDQAFSLGMIPHHQGAIAMAQIELRYGTDPQMRALAQTVIQNQQPEILQLQQWLAKHRSSTPTHSDAHMSEMQMTSHDHTDSSADMNHNAASTNPDVAFAQGMITHHQSALDMADDELKHGTDAQLRTLAQQIKAAQTPEIQQMQNWLASHH